LFSRIAATEPVPAFAANTVAITGLIAYLDQLAAHVSTTLLAPRIEPHIAPNRVLRAGCAAPFTLRPGQAAAFQRLDTALATATKGTAVRYIPLSAQPFDIATDFMTCATLYWSDGDHWSPSGEARFGARLLSALPAEFS
jgi:hypothetical protein